jgi:hypothetical protein
MEPDVCAVAALYNKAIDLTRVGHIARSAEYSARALAAAEALGAEDCLIVAQLQLKEAMRLGHAVCIQFPEDSAAAPADAFAPALSLFCAVAATLQRRRAAGTLMPGTCRAAEVAFQQLTTEHHHPEAVGQPATGILGFATFVAAALFAVGFVGMVITGVVRTTPEQLRDCVVLMADALELIMEPGGQERWPTVDESSFAVSMRGFVAEQQGFILGRGAAGSRLLDAWRRLGESGLRELLCSDEHVQECQQREHDATAANAAAAAAPGLRHCALESCGTREAHPDHFKSCAACRGPVYCGKEHQTEHWPAHKKACKAARKAKAENAQPADR